MPDTNAHGQPIGAPLPDWTAPAPLEAVAMAGRFCRLAPMDARHIRPLFDALATAPTTALWTYLPIGPFANAQELQTVLQDGASQGWASLAIIDPASEQVVGTASFMRIDAANGVAEIGAVIFSPRLQRSPVGTEAIYLMMRHMFAMGYRRCEWKCNALNAASRRAALRYGLSFEGVFRQAAVVKGHNRDTAWFACTDADWPQIRAAFEVWLAPANFDATGHQKQRLSTLTRGLLHWPHMPNGV